AQRYFYNHFFKVFGKARLLDAVRPRPGMPDDEITIDGIIESRLIYGSPETVAAKLVQLRNQAGPFGTLLVSGMDWAGPNAEWEKESLTLLAQEVAPIVRKETMLEEAV